MVPLFVVDAFTDQPFGGNPAAVCVLEPGDAGDGWPATEWMLAVAAEMRHSETAFLLPASPAEEPASPGSRRWHLRWCTPSVEVDLCGHATLAGAHALWTEGFAEPGAVLHFLTRSGVLAAQRIGAAVQLDFPALTSEPVSEPAGLEAALGARPVAVLRNPHDLLVELADATAVRDLRPDLRALAQVDARAVVVTAASDAPDADFVSRTFAPRVGIDEDPVTGSAHCALAPFWSSRLDRAALVGRQLSARGGTVRCTVSGERVLLAGTAVTVSRGELVV